MKYSFMEKQTNAEALVRRRWYLISKFNMESFSPHTCNNFVLAESGVEAEGIITKC